MKHKPLLMSLALALLLSPLSFAAETEIMPVKDIKPGMKGFGMTVFEGNKPEKFEFEVVGILKNSEPHQDIIVVRSSHPILSHTGICGGMSGSPMYIEGKLIGAASRFFKLFPKDLLTGVTPIERMISDGKRPTNPVDQSNSGGGGMPQTPPKNSGGMSLEQIPLPFYISGAKSGAIAAIQEQLKPYGIEIMTGASGAADPSLASQENADLKPGDAFSVQLLRGDIQFASGGTITYRDGNHILGFGHPFFSAGDVEMPLLTSQVFTVMSSLQRSDKMQVPVKEVGTLTIDRQSCVAGEIGKVARMLPIVIRTKNLMTGATEEFKCETIRHDFWTPLLFNLALMSAAESAENSSLPTTVDMNMKVWLEDRKEPMVLKETFANSDGPTNYAMTYPLQLLAHNPFTAVKFKRFEADLEISHEKKTAEIEAAWLDVNEVRPGEQVKINVVIRPFNKETQKIVVALKVPENLTDETYDLEIGSGGQIEPDAATAKNTEDVIRFLQSRYRASDLVTVLELGTIGTRQEGKALRQLPFSVFGTLFSSTSAGITIAPDTLRVVTPTPFVLNGKKALKIKVTTKRGG